MSSAGSPESLQRALQMLVEQLQEGIDPNEAVQQLASEHAELAPTLTAIGALFRVGQTTAVRQPRSQDADTVEFKSEPKSLGSLSIDDLHVRANSNRYDVQDEFARGGMGVIYRVRDQQLNRTLAMKVMGRDGKHRESIPYLAQFLEEVQVTAQLDHPGIVAVHELGVDDEGRPFFTMKLVKGRDFSEIMKWIPAEREGWNLSRGVGALVKVCQTIAYAHSKNVVHRDIKPSNIMVGRFGEIYVMDWGLAKVRTRPDLFDLRIVRDGNETPSNIQTHRSDETGDSPLITMDGTVVGTPSYMSLEQAQGEVDEIDAQSDVYSLGAVLYQLLAGTPPHINKKARVSPRTVLARVIDGPPTDVSRLNPAAPAELIAICDKAMSRDKSARYDSALDMAEDMQAWLDSRVVRAYRTGPLAELNSWVRRNRLAAGIAAASLAALVLLGGWWLRTEQQQGIQARHLLATNYLRQGQNNCEQGAIDRGLHWIARASETCPSEFEQLRSDIDANFSLWSQRCNRLLQVLDHESDQAEPFPMEQPLMMAISPDGANVVTGGFRNINAKLWSREDGSEKKHLELDSRPRGLLYSHDGKRLTVVHDGGLQFLDDAGEEVHPPIKVNVFRFGFHPASSMLAVVESSNERKVKLFSLDEGKQIEFDAEGTVPTKRRLSMFPNSLHFSEDGKRLLYRTPKLIRIWDTETGKELAALDDFPGNVVAANADADVAILLDPTYRACTVWSISKNEALSAPLRHDETIRCLELSPDGQTLATGSGNNGRLFSTSDGSTKGGLLRHRAPNTHIVFSPDSQLIATFGLDMAARLWTVNDGKPRGVEIASGQYGVDDVTFSQDSSHMAVSFGGKAEIWSTNAVVKPAMVFDNGPNVWGLKFHPHQPLVAVNGRHDRMSLFNHETGEVAAELPDVGTAWTLTFSHDGDRIASGCYDDQNSVRITPTDVDAISDENTVMCHNQSMIRAIAFSHDGEVIATGDFDQKAKLWSTRTGETLQTIEHPGIVEDLTFSMDDSTLITSCSDGIVRYWSVETNELIDSRDMGSAVLAVELSPDGKMVATGGSLLDPSLNMTNGWKISRSVPTDESWLRVVPMEAYRSGASSAARRLGHRSFTAQRFAKSPLIRVDGMSRVVPKNPVPGFGRFLNQRDQQEASPRSRAPSLEKAWTKTES